MTSCILSYGYDDDRCCVARCSAASVRAASKSMDTQRLAIFGDDKKAEQAQGPSRTLLYN
jgi:hypothetical protein